MNGQTLTEEKRAVKVFELWCWPSVFQKILDGVRSFDIRKDQGCMAGDVIRYRERDMDGAPQYTGSELHADVRCVVHGTRTEEHAMPRRENPILTGYVVMGIHVQKDSVKLRYDAKETTAPTQHSTELAAA